MTTNLSYSALDKCHQKLSVLPRTADVELELSQLYSFLMKVFICHSINQMFKHRIIPELYKEYFDWKLKNYASKESGLDFDTFRTWLSVESVDNLMLVSERVKQKIYSSQESLTKQ